MIVDLQGWLLDTLNIGRLLGLPLPVPTLLTSKITPISPPLLSYIGSMSVHIAAPVLLTSLLYLGPLLTRFLDGQLPFQRQFNFHTDIVERFTSLAGVRNFLVGPATEELVFRASILAPLYFAGVTRAKVVLATPGFFGIAHVHHAYNVYVSGGRTRSAAIRGAITATAQFVYTTAFGWYANFLFLRAGSVVAPTAAHALCNVLGLPNPAADSQSHPTKSTRKSYTPLPHDPSSLTESLGIVAWDWHSDMDSPRCGRGTLRPLPLSPDRTGAVWRFTVLARMRVRCALRFAPLAGRAAASVRSRRW